MTGPQGGSWIPLGGALKGMWEKAVPPEHHANPGAGIANVRGIDEGKAQIGLANSSTGRRHNGRPPPEEGDQVCHRQPVPSTSRSSRWRTPGERYADLRQVGSLPGQGQHGRDHDRPDPEGERLTISLGRIWPRARSTDAVSMMKDGHAHVMTLGTTAPASAVMDLASARDVKLVPVDEKTHDFVKKANAATTSSPSRPALSEAGPRRAGDRLDAPGRGVRPAENTVYQMVKTMAGNVDAMAAVVKSIEGIKPKDMAQDIGVPFHKGAVKFYKEAGAM